MIVIVRGGVMCTNQYTVKPMTPINSPAVTSENKRLRPKYSVSTVVREPVLRCVFWSIA